jgi:hypothetical protein
MLSIAGIVASLALLMWFAYRGISVLLLAPLAALVAVLATPNVPLLASYTQVFMKAAGGFVALFFPLFLLGALFGKLMEDSGAARAIALRSRGLACGAQCWPWCWPARCSPTVACRCSSSPSRSTQWRSNCSDAPTCPSA